MWIEIKADDIDKVLAPAELRLGPAREPVIGLEFAEPLALGCRNFRLALMSRRDVDQRFGPDERRVRPALTDRLGRGDPGADQLALEPPGCAWADAREISVVDGPDRKLISFSRQRTGGRAAYRPPDIKRGEGEVGEAFGEIGSRLVDVIR